MNERAILDIAIVEFNTDVRIVQPFVSIEYMEPVQLQAGGGTNMEPAIQLAID